MVLRVYKCREYMNIKLNKTKRNSIKSKEKYVYQSDVISKQPHELCNSIILYMRGRPENLLNIVHLQLTSNLVYVVTWSDPSNTSEPNIRNKEKAWRMGRNLQVTLSHNRKLFLRPLNLKRFPFIETAEEREREKKSNLTQGLE